MSFDLVILIYVFILFRTLRTKKVLDREVQDRYAFVINTHNEVLKPFDLKRISYSEICRIFLIED